MYKIVVEYCDDKRETLPMQIHEFVTALHIVFHSEWNTKGDHTMIRKVQIIDTARNNEVVTFAPAQP